jgi:HD superfamily phosphodiesterase
MKKVHDQIWKLAKPYYLRGRPMDIDHIEWMMKDALLVCKNEDIDETLLLPLVILHDVGYANVPKDNPYKLNLRKAHMKEGAKIAKEILKKVNYPVNKTKKIVYYVSVHDNWAFDQNDIYKNDKILGNFTDLDFIWMATPKGFPAMKKILNKNSTEMYNDLKNDEKIIKRPFSSKTTLMLFNKYLNKIKKNKK